MPTIAAQIQYPAVMQSGVASTITLKPKGAANFDSVSITFSDNGAGGSFSPSNVVACGTGTSATVNYTPPSNVSDVKFTVSNGSGLPNWITYVQGTAADNNNTSFAGQGNSFRVAVQPYAPVKRQGGFSNSYNGTLSVYPTTFTIPYSGKFGNIFYGATEQPKFTRCTGTNWIVKDPFGNTVQSGTITSGVVGPIAGLSNGAYTLQTWSSGAGDANQGDSTGCWDFIVCSTATNAAGFVERPDYWSQWGVFGNSSSTPIKTASEDPNQTHGNTSGVWPIYIVWTGNYVAPTTGTYQFQCYCLSGIKLTVNGVVVVDQLDLNNATNDPQTQVGTISLTSGQSYAVKLEASPQQNHQNGVFVYVSVNGGAANAIGTAGGEGGAAYGYFTDESNNTNALTARYYQNVAAQLAAGYGAHSEIDLFSGQNTTRLSITCSTCPNQAVASNPGGLSDLQLILNYLSRKMNTIGFSADPNRPFTPIIAIRSYCGGYSGNNFTAILTSNVSSGQNQANLNFLPTGQGQVGAVVRFSNGTNSEAMTVQAIAGGLITFTTNFQFSYTTGNCTIVPDRTTEQNAVRQVVNACLNICPNCVFEQYNEPSASQYNATAQTFWNDVRGSNYPNARVGGPCFVQWLGNQSSWDAVFNAGNFSYSTDITTHPYSSPELGTAPTTDDNASGFMAYLATKSDPLNTGKTLAQRNVYLTENGARMRSFGTTWKLTQAVYAAYNRLRWARAGLPIQNNYQWTPYTHGDVNWETALLSAAQDTNAHFLYYQPTPALLVERVMADVLFGTANVTPTAYAMGTLAPFVEAWSLPGTSTNGNQTISVFHSAWDPDLSLTFAVSGGNGTVTVVDYAGNISTVTVSCGAITLSGLGLPQYVKHQAGQTLTPIGVNWGTNLALSATVTVTGSASSVSVINDGTLQDSSTVSWGNRGQCYRDALTSTDDNGAQSNPSNFPFDVVFDLTTAHNVNQTILFNGPPYRAGGNAQSEIQWYFSDDNITYTAIGPLIDDHVKSTAAWHLQDGLGSSVEGTTYPRCARNVGFTLASHRYWRKRTNRAGFGQGSSQLEAEGGKGQVTVMFIPWESISDIQLYNAAPVLNGDVATWSAMGSQFTVHLLALNDAPYTGATVFTLTNNGGAAASISSQANVDGTHQNMTINPGGATGSITLTSPGGATWTIPLTAAPRYRPLMGVG